MAAAATGHTQTSKRIEFCRAPNCKKTNYRDSCPASWKNEAHHILCVNQVNKCVVGKTQEVQQVIDESQWCINDPNNMVALPLWGTTVMHYCRDFSSITDWDVKGLLKGIAGSLLKTEQSAPAFENLPQHNYGHSGEDASMSYNLEIQKKLEKWIAKIQVDIQAHSITGPDIHEDLNTMSDDMRKELNKRGTRMGSTLGTVGTHAAWLHPAPNWYVTFSMARVPKPMPQPKMTAKIVRIAEALWRG
jgi:hypothetical protein